MQLVPTEKPLEFSIPILPNPKNGEFTAKVVFYGKDNIEKKAIKEKYVKEELKYCYDEYVKYWTAIGTSKRAAAYQTLSAKRVAFARFCGYGPKGTNKALWVHQYNPPPAPKAV